MTRARPLSELLAGYAPAPAGCAVRGVRCRSAEIRPGELFAACAGRRAHGLAGLAEALRRGAAAVAYEPGPGAAAPAAAVPCIAVPDLSRRLGEIAARFFDRPSRALSVIGVTGTDGKTSTAHLAAQLLRALQRGCGLIGTLGAGAPEALRPTGMTTPDAARLQAELHRMVRRRAAYAVLEVSSHALDQRRCDAVRFDAAVFTTLGRDHLEYHGGAERYAAAKRRLFAELRPRRAVLNVDDPFGRALAAELAPALEVRRCALDADADETARDIAATPEGLAFTWRCGEREERVRVPGLYGRFNVVNLLLAAAAVRACGLPAAAVGRAMAACAPAPGRLERFGPPARPVFVDYAHTAEALAAALDALRAHFGRPVHCVFGAGGERDRGKRPRMAAAAERGAARLTLTDDNPRGEEPRRIFADLRAGLRRPERARLLPDRAAAIARAVAERAPDEVVLIAGRGHETEQHAAAGPRPFSDRAAVRAALAAAA